jgi:hypothetical protein
MVTKYLSGWFRHHCSQSRLLGFKQLETPMHRALKTLACALALIGLSGYARAQDALKSGPQPGEAVPGPFQVLQVTGAKDRTERFVCPVCEGDFGPVVLVFFREPGEANGPVATLLQKLDEFMETHPDLRLGIYGIYLNDGGYYDALVNKVEDAKVAELALTKAILSKDQKASQLTKLADGAKLQHVVLALATVEGPKAYKLSKDAEVTVLFYTKHQIVGNYVFAKDQFTAEAAEKVFKEIQGALALDAPKSKRKK